MIVTRKEWIDDDIKLHEGAMGAAGASRGVAGGSVDRICGAEPGATKSLMHRYNTGSDLLPGCRADGEAGLVVALRGRERHLVGSTCLHCARCAT